MKVKWLTLVFPIVGILVAAGCAPAKVTPEAQVPAGYERIRMVGSSIGSDSTTTVMAYAAILNKYLPEVDWSSSSGDVGTNPVFLTKGTMKLGLVLPAGYVQAYGFDKIPESRLRSISHPSPTVHYLFLIPEDKPWTDMAQVPKGSSLIIGGVGTTTLGCETWLDVAGLSRKDFKVASLGKAETADAWRAGKGDVVFLSVSGLFPALMDMYTSPRKFKPLGMSAEHLAKAKATQAFERVGFETPSQSNLTQSVGEVFKYDVVVPQQTKFLASRDDFPDELAYKMAKVIDERNADLAGVYATMKWGTPQWHVQWAKPPLDIHPGVARYYKEKGYLK